jgi:hypothetical protein
MKSINDLTHGRITVRLIADAVELQQHTRQPAHLVAVPGTGRVIAIGTPAEVAQLLAIAPAASGCTVPPVGWYCTRAPGHAGSCAALPVAIEHDHSEGGHHD